MKSFKTPKGTELPLLNIKGKDYLQVAHRLVWFREEHPSWVIETEFIRLDDKTAICKAMIKDDQGSLRAMAHKREDTGHFPDHMEKAETSAIGRALALIGYGTQFTDDFEEGTRLADAPLTKTSTACPQPTAEDGNQEPIHYKISFGKYAQKTLEQIDIEDLRSYVMYLETKAKKDGKEITGVVAEFIAKAEEYIGAWENGS